MSPVRINTEEARSPRPGRVDGPKLRLARDGQTREIPRSFRHSSTTSRATRAHQCFCSSSQTPVTVYPLRGGSIQYSVSLLARHTNIISAESVLASRVLCVLLLFCSFAESHESALPAHYAGLDLRYSKPAPPSPRWTPTSNAISTTNSTTREKSGL